MPKYPIVQAAAGPTGSTFSKLIVSLTVAAEFHIDVPIVSVCNNDNWTDSGDVHPGSSTVGPWTGRTHHGHTRSGEACRTLVVPATTYQCICCM